VSSWIVRFIWPYIGIVIAYSIIIFFLIKPLKKFNKFVYLGFLVLYFCGVGIRGMGKSHPAY
jgi:Na+(H+)/acetate symporter ActP